MRDCCPSMVIFIMTHTLTLVHTFIDMCIYVYIQGKPYDDMILKVEKSVNAKSVKAKNRNVSQQNSKGIVCLWILTCVYIHIIYVYIMLYNVHIGKRCMRCGQLHDSRSCTNEKICYKCMKPGMYVCIRSCVYTCVNELTNVYVYVYMLYV